ncbi:hypothetical protein VTO73DRAFT_9806 [Trametes versicolor]
MRVGSLSKNPAPVTENMSHKAQHVGFRNFTHLLSIRQVELDWHATPVAPASLIRARSASLGDLTDHDAKLAHGCHGQQICLFCVHSKVSRPHSSRRTGDSPRAAHRIFPRHQRRALANFRGADVQELARQVSVDNVAKSCGSRSP